MIFIHSPVGKYQNICSVFICLIHFHKQTVDGAFQLGTLIISNRNHSHLETRYFHLFDFQHVGIGQNRITDFQHLTVFRLFFQQISFLTYIYCCTCNDFFTDRINRRIGYLCKQLFKIIKQGTFFFRKYSQWCIHTHGSNRLSAIECHITD